MSPFTGSWPIKGSCYVALTVEHVSKTVVLNCAISAFWAWGTVLQHSYQVHFRSSKQFVHFL